MTKFGRIRQVGRDPALPNFGGSLLFMPTPFDVELQFGSVTHVGRRLVFRGQQCNGWLIQVMQENSHEMLLCSHILRMHFALIFPVPSE